MVVEIGYPTGRESSCRLCGEALSQVEWTWGMTWSHESGSAYCADAPQAEPVDSGDSGASS